VKVSAQLRLQLGYTLLQLRIKSREIELPSLRSGQAVQLPEIRSVRQVHGIEPFASLRAGSINQLVGDILTQDVIEALGQFCGHRHVILNPWSR
jgi:hypothetical protein